MRVSTHIKVKHPHNGTKVFFKGFNKIDPSVPNALQKLDVHNDLIKKKKKKTYSPCEQAKDISILDSSRGTKMSHVSGGARQ